MQFNRASFLALLFASLLVVSVFGSMVKPAYAVSVTVPITINMRTGSDTPETAGVSFAVTCTGGGGTHDGNPATQNFTCDNGVTVTVAKPADAASSKFRFSDGSESKPFTSCASGTCPTTTYNDVTRQVLTEIVTSGLDSNQAEIFTVRQLGSYVTEPVTSGGKFLNFDGTNDFGNVTDSSHLDFTSAMSVSAWIRADEIPASFTSVIRKDGAYILEKQSDNKLRFAIWSGSALGSVASSTTTIAADKWYHIVGTYDGTNLKVYVNGSLETTQARTGSIDTNANNLFFASDAGAGSFFHGSQDDVRLYNRALNATEASRLYSGVHVSSGLKAWYKNDNGSGTSSSDSSGNSLTMTLTNGPTWQSNVWQDQTTVMTTPRSMSLSSTERFANYANVVNPSSLTASTTDGTNTASKANDDNTGTFWRSGSDQEAGAYIYADLGYKRQIAGIRLYHDVSNEIPATVNIYAANTTANWGTALRTSVSLTQATGYQTHTFDDRVAQYVKIEVASWGSPARWRLAEFDMLPMHGNALQAINTGNYARASPTTTDLSFQNFTVMAWINLNRDGSPPDEDARNEMIGATNVCGVNNGWEFKIDTENNQSGLEYGYYNGDAHLYGDTWYQTNTFIDTVYEANKWYHIAATTYMSGSNREIEWYIDGNLFDTFTRTANTTIYYGNGASNGLSVGWINENNSVAPCTTSHINSHIFNGTIDDFRIYNERITASEIKTIFADGSIIDSNSLKVHYTFDQDVGSTSIADATGNGNTATMAGSAALVPSPYKTGITSGGGIKTLIWNHEYSMTPRVYEEHEGVIFSPMPSATYTATLTSSNSTQTSITYSTAGTDDYTEPSTDYWFGNSTTTWTDVSWRGLVVNATGSRSITSAGNFDVVSTSKHVGYGPPYHHFRVATNGATTEIDNVSFNDDTATLTFNATASGTKTTKVEFLNSDYGGVSRVVVAGADLDSANWSVATVDSTTNVLTISGVSFSEKTFVIYFSASGTGSGGGGGGGGGGGSGSDTGVVIVVPQPGNFPLGLEVSVPPFSVAPGQSQTQMISIKWTGATRLVIQNIEFSSDQGIFKIGKSLPFAAVLAEGQQATEVPLTVTLSESEQGLAKTVQMRVTALANGGTSQQTVPVMINLVPTNNLALYGGIGVVVAIAGAVALRNKKR